MHLRRALFATLFLAACFHVQEWDIFSDRAVNITFAHDPAYVRDQAVSNEDVQFEDKTIAVADIALRRQEPGEMAFIEVMQTEDPLIVSYLMENSIASRQVHIDNLQAQTFESDGMGTPVHYLFRKNGLYIVLSFVFPPSEEDIDRVLNSVVLR